MLLAQYDNNRQSMDFYNQLAWGGLLGTNAWNQLPAQGVDTIAIHNTIYHEEQGDSQAKGLRCLTVQ